MKLLVLGSGGQVGWELQRALAPLGEVVAWDRRQADLAKPELVATRVAELAPSVIVNAAAYTAVDKAESEPELAHLVNTEAPARLAKLGIPLIHYSSDYVFDGSGVQARDEDAATGPLSVYGRTKLEGELAIRASGTPHLILRTSWVYAARGGNFAKTMLRLALDREQLRVVDDQIGAPTGAELLADCSAQLIGPLLAGASGVFHLTAAGETSWAEYARFVIAGARALGHELRCREVVGIASSDYPTPARRPLNSRLACRRIQAQFGLHLPDWRVGVQRMLEEIT